ncbi:ATP-binding protein [Saccharothrix sp.]|uniref:ATP-binding protein n=1 Tax=Saccharothrix sp. TaxID=1873460 RepID=UPI00281271BE|nr:ATP-binding protein [Saccharothrix sp.]
MPLGLIRRWLAEIFAGAGEQFLVDVTLVCTELVANAFDHARPPRALCDDVGTGGEVRVEVDDGSRDEMPVLGSSRVSDRRGRGLLIVHQVCASWGVVRHDAGNTVWAVVSAPGSRRAEPATSGWRFALGSGGNAGLAGPGGSHVGVHADSRG